MVTDTDIQITATLSPDEDGTPFTRSYTPKSHPVAVKTPSTSSCKPKQHEAEPPQSKAGNTTFETHGREAANQQTAQTTTENNGGEKDEKDEQLPKSSTPFPTAKLVQETNKETSSNKITTTAEINLCEKHIHLSQQLLPLINPSTIKQEDSHTPNVVRTLDPECEKDDREKDEHINDKGTKTDKPLLANPVPGSVSTTTDTRILRTSDKKIETEKQCSQPVTDDLPLQSLPSSELDQHQQDNLHSQEQHENETDEHKRQAADGLLMLQELARFDDFETEEDLNSQLMPIGTDLIEPNPDTAIYDVTGHTMTSGPTNHR